MEEAHTSQSNIGLGYYLAEEEEISIDRNKLLKEFNGILRNHYNNQADYEKARSQIPVKVLVLHDRFYVAGIDDEWSEAYYFQYREGNKILFLNTRNNKGYYLSNGVPQWVPIEPVIRDKIVIDRVNEVVSAYTNAYITNSGAHRYSNNQLTIEIQNPTEISLDKLDGMSNEEISNLIKERYRQENFNILDGITFFTVYLEEQYLSARDQEIVYQNYNVAGYTMEAKRKIQNN